MTKPLTKIPDIAYSIEGDLIELEQSTGCGEFTIVELHKIHLQLLAEQTGLLEPDQAARMGEIVKQELCELLDGIGELWEDLGDSSYIDLEMLIKAKALHQKTLSIARLAGCNFDDAPSVDELIADSLPAKSNGQASLLEVAQ